MDRKRIVQNIRIQKDRESFEKRMRESQFQKLSNSNNFDSQSFQLDNIPAEIDDTNDSDYIYEEHVSCQTGRKEEETSEHRLF